MSANRHHARAVGPLVVALLALGSSGCGDGGGARPGARTPEPRATATRTEEKPLDRQAPALGAAWTHAAVLRRIDGRRIEVDGRTVRIDRATLACGGVGQPTTRRRGEPAWARFRCVQPTFPAGSVAGPDAIFVVTPTGAHTAVMTDRRLTGY
jgi:hypothetical protein